MAKMDAERAREPRIFNKSMKMLDETTERNMRALVAHLDRGSGLETSAGSSPVSGTYEGEMVIFEARGETLKKCTLATSWPLLRSNIPAILAFRATRRGHLTGLSLWDELQFPFLPRYRNLRSQALGPAISIHPPCLGEPIIRPASTGSSSARCIMKAGGYAGP